MNAAERTRLKICCIQDVAEAELAIAHGADGIGLVSAMPSGPGPIPEREIARIVAAVGDRSDTFLLTSRRDLHGIERQVANIRPSTVQIVDAVSTDVYRGLRERFPALAIVQVLHVAGERTIDDAVAIGRHVDALLLDSGSPKAATRTLGGTGRTHDWRVSRRAVEAAECPVFLAGGLTPDNVAEAVETVGPFGVDVCNGVRTEGRLDADALARFAAALG